MREICPNNFRNNDRAKELRIIPAILKHNKNIGIKLNSRSKYSNKAVTYSNKTFGA